MPQGKLIRIEGPNREQNAHIAGRIAEKLRSEDITDAVRVSGPFATAASAAIHSVLNNWGKSMSPRRQLELWAISAGEVYDQQIAPRLNEGITVVEDPGIAAALSRTTESGVGVGDVAETIRRQIGGRYLDPDAVFSLYRSQATLESCPESERKTYERFHAAELALSGMNKVSICADDEPEDIEARIMLRTRRLYQA